MSVQRFHAASTREALQQVRARLGEDALVLANHATTAGVEILALAAADAEHMADVSAMGGATLGERLLRELSTLHARIDAPREAPPVPAEAALWQRLRAAGFSAELGQSILNALPAQPAAGWLAHTLAARLAVADAQALASARAIVVLGADAEARAALVAHFARALAGDGPIIINADCRRAGMREQTAAQLAALRVDLPVVAADGTLADVLATSTADRRAIIVAPAPDATDPWTLAQLHAACGVDGAVPVLVLDAALQPEALEHQVTACRAVLAEAGARLADACIAGADGVARLGPVLDVLIRHRLTLHAVMAHRAPPELVRGDATDAAALVARALAAAGTDGHAEPLPRTRQLLRQGRALGEALARLRQRATGFEVVERAWSARRLAPALQEQQAEAAWAAASGTATAWRWYHTEGAGSVAQGLDASGLPLPGVIIYALTGAMLPALVAEETRMAGAVQLLPAPPEGKVWCWLAGQAPTWIAGARGGTRIWHAGERKTLAACRSVARQAGDTVLHWHGRSVHLAVRRAPVALDLRGVRATALLDAWFAELRDRATGAPLPARCGLLPRGLAPALALRLVAQQLQTEHLPPLETLAQRELAALGGTLAGAATQLAATSLAALAARLDGEADAWALALRVELQTLAGGRRGRGAKALLTSLITLLATRDALREIGVPAWQAGA